MCHAYLCHNLSEGIPKFTGSNAVLQPEYKFMFSCFQSFLLSTGDVKWKFQNFAR